MFTGLQHFVQDKCFLALGNLTSCYGSTLLRHLETLNTDFFFSSCRHTHPHTWASFRVSRLLWAAGEGLYGGPSRLRRRVNIKPKGHLPAMWSCALAASHTAGQASPWLHWGAPGACPEAGRYWSPAESLHLKAAMWRRRALREAGWALA